jgi:CBS domain-containing protein
MQRGPSTGLDRQGSETTLDIIQDMFYPIYRSFLAAEPAAVGDAGFGGSRKKVDMIRLVAKDIMSPRVSLYANDKGSELVKKPMINYPALPGVNDDLEVIGIVSDYDVLDALNEKRTVHEFSAESLMSCGHAEHGVCTEPLTISANMLIDDIANTLYKERVSVLPVVDERRKLVGIIIRKSIINTITELGVWPEVDFRKRAA